MGLILYWIIGLYLLVLFARAIISMVPLFIPDWRPTGIVVVVAEVMFTLTDPPLKALNKVLPPLRIGNVALDVSFIILWFGLVFLQSLVLRIP